MSIDNIINTALSGNPDAQQLLGFYYYNGNEFEKDIQEAIFGMKKRLHKAMTTLCVTSLNITTKQVNIKNQSNGTENIPKNELNGATSVLIGKIKGKVS